MIIPRPVVHQLGLGVEFAAGVEGCVVVVGFAVGVRREVRVQYRDGAVGGVEVAFDDGAGGVEEGGDVVVGVIQVVDTIRRDDLALGVAFVAEDEGDLLARYGVGPITATLKGVKYRKIVKESGTCECNE